MGEVVSFRPSREEAALIERARRRMGLRTRAEAVRFLIREGSERGKRVADAPVFKLRAPEKYRLKRSLSSEEIDEVVYGGDP